MYRRRGDIGDTHPAKYILYHLWLYDTATDRVPFHRRDIPRCGRVVRRLQVEFAGVEVDDDVDGLRRRDRVERLCLRHRAREAVEKEAIEATFEKASAEDTVRDELLKGALLGDVYKKYGVL